MSDVPVKFSDELIISDKHLGYIQEYASYVAGMNQVLGYNIAHNNSYREIAAVALDQRIYPQLGITHNGQITGIDAKDMLGRSREYKKIELGPGYKKPFQRQFKKHDESIVIKNRRGTDGFQPSKIGFQLTRFRNTDTQARFVTHDALIISLFFSEVAMPSISYVIRSENNLKKLVVFYNQFLYNTPQGTNKWSHNNVRIPLTWILKELDQRFIDVIALVNGQHQLLTVQQHDTFLVGEDLTPTGFFMDDAP